MQDLLAEFDAPSVMDCKMGIRYYLFYASFTNCLSFLCNMHIMHVTLSTYMQDLFILIE